MIGVYLIGYGIVRFFIEYFREPDVELGFVLPLGGGGDISLVDSLFNITTGQILCFAMVLAGVLIILGVRIYAKRAVIREIAVEKPKKNYRKIRKSIKKKK